MQTHAAWMHWEFNWLPSSCHEKFERFNRGEGLPGSLIWESWENHDRFSSHCQSTSPFLFCHATEGAGGLPGCRAIPADRSAVEPYVCVCVSVCLPVCLCASQLHGMQGFVARIRAQRPVRRRCRRPTATDLFLAAVVCWPHNSEF